MILRIWHGWTTSVFDSRRDVQSTQDLHELRLVVQGQVRGEPADTSRSRPPT